MPKSANPSKRARIWNETGGRCAYCNWLPGEKMRSLDHVFPASLGGTFADDNLIPACVECNSRRGTKIPASDHAHPKWKEYVKGKEKR